MLLEARTGAAIDFVIFSRNIPLPNILMAPKLHNIARQSYRSVYLSCNSLSIIQKIQAPVTISLEKCGLSSLISRPKSLKLTALPLSNGA